MQKRAGPIDFQISGFNRYSSVYFSPGRPARADPLHRHRPDRLPPQHRDRAQGDGSWRISPEHTLRSGFYIQGERSTFSTNSSVLPVDEMGMQTTDQPISIFDAGGKTGWLYSYYLQDEWKIVPTLTVNFGARFDLVDEFAHAHQLSPRVNVVWQPTDTTTFTAGLFALLRAAAFRTHRAADDRALRQYDRRAGDHRDTTSKPERDHYFDIGASQVILPGLKAGIDAYYKIASNLLDEGQFGTPILLTPFNYQKGLVKGVELLLSYEIENWSFYGNFAASKALGKDINSAQFNFDPDELAYIAEPLHPSRSRSDLYVFGRHQVPSTRPGPCFPPT